MTVAGPPSPQPAATLVARTEQAGVAASNSVIYEVAWSVASPQSRTGAAVLRMPISGYIGLPVGWCGFSLNMRAATRCPIKYFYIAFGTRWRKDGALQIDVFSPVR